MERLPIQVVIPLHQSIDASDEDIAQACSQCYMPLFDTLETQTSAKVALFLNGHLRGYLARQREDVLLRVRSLYKAGKIEVLGGLFHAGVVESLPEQDITGQLQMCAEFWDSYLGKSPRGFWLPEFTWCEELPRLFRDTGLDYGFVCASQLAQAQRSGLGIVERADDRIAAFVLDDTLSAPLPHRPVQEWIDALLDRAGPRSSDTPGVVSVWLEAESLVRTPDRRPRSFDTDWLRTWLEALGGKRDEVMTRLPEESFALVRPASVLDVRTGCAPNLETYDVSPEASFPWRTFRERFEEVDTLHRRMLRLSRKLRDAIANMEDEGLEEAWSDRLATAQRLAFSAQSSDAYWRGRKPGFSDPRVRDATLERLSQAETIIDALAQQDRSWIVLEEADYDADLRDETFVCTPHINAWLVPHQGGRLRCFDARAIARNVLDVATRASEPFHDAMQQAPLASGDQPVDVDGALPRLRAELPAQSDARPRRGIATFVVPAETTSTQFFEDPSLDVTLQNLTWRVTSSGIEKEGDPTYHLELCTEMQDGTRNGWALEKRLTLPAGGPELKLAYRATVSGDRPVAVATEIPIRLGCTPAQVFVNAKPVEAQTSEHTGVDLVRVVTSNGTALEIAADQPFSLWHMKVTKSLRAERGYDIAHEGDVLVPVFAVSKSAAFALTVRLFPPK